LDEEKQAMSINIPRCYGHGPSKDRDGYEAESVEPRDLDQTVLWR
jgi:hypothetical protein